MTNAAALQTGSLALAFALAGRARLTLVSQKTGTRFTYRIGKKDTDRGAIYFVSLLSGANNEADFVFLGTIFTHKDAGKPSFYVHSQKSSVGRDAPSARAFAWAWASIAQGVIPQGCEVWHEGKCGHCGRALTVPESIATGFGPVCAGGAA